MRGRTSMRPIPAFVVGGSLSALGVVRSLSHGHVPTFVLATRRKCPAAWSRHCTYIGLPSLEGDVLIEALVQLASGFESRPVLILTTDESVNAVSEARDRIDPLYCIDLPAPSMVRTLADKTEFHAFAEREQFPVPRSRTVRAAADIDGLSELEPPVVLKPADKTLVLSGAVPRAVRANSFSEAREAATQMLACAPSLIVQEWVEGPDTEIFFSLFSCDRGAKIIGIFAGRKIVCWPPAVGSTAVCGAAPEVAEELHRQTCQFVKRVGYRGLGSLEFKRDRRTGRLLIIEPTVGRTDWQEEIATLCGVNLPLLAYHSALDSAAPHTSSSPLAARVWRSERQFVVPSRGIKPGTRVIDGYFRWHDPLPAVYYYGYERFALRAWRRAVHVTRRAFPHVAEVN